MCNCSSDSICAHSLVKPGVAGFLLWSAPLNEMEKKKPEEKNGNCDEREQMKLYKSQVLRNGSLELRRILRAAEYAGRKEQQRSSSISMSSVFRGASAGHKDLSLPPGHSGGWSESKQGSAGSSIRGPPAASSASLVNALEHRGCY